MKLNYPARFLLTAVAIILAAYFWFTDGIERGLDLKGGASLTYQIDTSGIPQMDRSEALQSTVRVIEDRINNLGLKDLKVDALPPDQFEVQFPGRETRDVDRIKSILTKLGQLEFRIVALPANAEYGDPGLETSERKKREEMGEAYPGPPPGHLWIARKPGRDEQGREIPAGPDRLVEAKDVPLKQELARRQAVLDEVKAGAGNVAEAEAQVAEAQQSYDDYVKKHYFTGADLDPGALGIRANPYGAGWIVLFATSDKRKIDFGDFTETNVKRQMAILIDGKIESSPVIQEKLPGRGQISGGGMGGFGKDEAQDLVTVLRSGSLDVGIRLQSEFAIGPSLGEAAIQRGMLATALGFSAVVIFMLGAYLFPGLVAIFALIMNLLMIMGALAFARAQLSLPGIAGVILTVGMAVDANILVFERIREERNLGKSLAQAVKAGYARAFITIVDANVTTLFTAGVLFFATEGVVRGFAVTLFVGILASMFTALFVTKAIFGFMVDKGLMTEMRMPKIFGQPKVSYMRVRLPMMFISLVLIGAGVFAFQSAGPDKYDIEFTGGQRVVVAFSGPLEISDMKERIQGSYPDATVISIKSDRPDAEALDLTRESDSFQITIAIPEEYRYDIEFADDSLAVMGFLEPLALAEVKERIQKTYPGAAVSVKADADEAGTRNEGDKFEIRIAIPEEYRGATVKFRHQVITFLFEEFKDTLSPGGAGAQEFRNQVIGFLNQEFEDILAPIVVVEKRAESESGVVADEYELSFDHPVSEAKILDLIQSAKGVGENAQGDKEAEVVSVDEASARVRVVLTPTADPFVGRTLSEPFPAKSFVDPQTAQKHRDDAIQAVIIALVFQILYIYFRFHGASFGFAAVLALVHDVLITLGAIAFFSWIGLVNVKINLPIIAAILTLIGYSMNDTIVVFDRIRENLGRGRATLSEVIDHSVNQTMSRSLKTSITTFIVVLIVFVVNYGAASSVLEGFAFVLMVGVITGTYSSIFVASPMLLFLPWHYLRLKRSFFWPAVAASLFGLAAGLFVDDGSAMQMVFLLVSLTYPALFLVDLVRWLFLSDPDRSLNIVLRNQGAPV